MKKKAAEEKLKVDLVEMEVTTIGDIAEAFDFFEKEAVKGVLVTADSFFNNNRKVLVEHAAARDLPTIYQCEDQYINFGFGTGPERRRQIRLNKSAREFLPVDWLRNCSVEVHGPTPRQQSGPEFWHPQ